MYSGFNEYAVTNDLIILYPQVNGNAWFNTYNCWDIGIQRGSDPYYATNHGYQPKAIKAMIDRLTSPIESDKAEEYTKWNVLDRPQWM